MTSINAALMKALDIRFIDARSMSMEARANLGIVGYPDPDQHQALLAEAIRIFVNRSQANQDAMRQQKQMLEAAIRELCKDIDTKKADRRSRSPSRTEPTSSLSSRRSSFHIQDIDTLSMASDASDLSDEGMDRKVNTCVIL